MFLNHSTIFPSPLRSWKSRHENTRDREELNTCLHPCFPDYMEGWGGFSMYLIQFFHNKEFSPACLGLIYALRGIYQYSLQPPTQPKSQVWELLIICTIILKVGLSVWCISKNNDIACIWCNYSGKMLNFQYADKVLFMRILLDCWVADLGVSVRCQEKGNYLNCSFFILSSKEYSKGEFGIQRKTLKSSQVVFWKN